MKMKDFVKKNQSWICAIFSFFLFWVPLVRIVYINATHGLFLIDLAAYSDISLILFKGNNPFPDHVDLLTLLPLQNDVPIVYPGQMLLFALPGFLWGSAVQITYLLLNIGIVFFLTGLTLVKACGYHWDDLWKPGWKQLVYALFCFCFFSSNNYLNTMRLGQIPVILALCIYLIFWGPSLRSLRTFLFAFVAVTKYSVLPVFAPLLFFKGYWKLCIAAFSLFVLLSISPVFCGNNLKEVYQGYFEAVKVLFQPGSVNHFDRNPMMCHLGFSVFPGINIFMKAVAAAFILWLFWRERKTRYFSDTMLLLAFSLTMLTSYHAIHDMSLLFPLFFIRLFSFAKEKNWSCLGITTLFLLYLIIPGGPFIKVSSMIGALPGIGSVIILANRPYGQELYHVFPVTPFYSIALAVWSLYLYLRVKAPYRFVIPELISQEKALPLPDIRENLNSGSPVS